LSIYHPSFSIIQSECHTHLKPEVIYSEDFESGAPGWEHFTFEGSDLWHRTSVDAHSGQWSMGCFDENNGFYDNNMGWDCLISPVFDFSSIGAKSAEFSFWAKWSFESPSDTWMIMLYDPSSNYVLGMGPLSTYYSRNMSQEIHGEVAQPEWWGPEHNWGYGQDIPESNGRHFFIRDIFPMIDYWRNRYPGMMFTQGYKCGIGFAIYETDDKGYMEPDMPEKWSGLYIDDVNVIAYVPNQVVYNETQYVTLPGQPTPGENPAELTFTTLLTEYGDYQIDVRTDLSTDQVPDNDWMDGYTDIYYIKWLDQVEYQKDPETGEYINDWTTQDLTGENTTHWHIEPVKCGHYNVLSEGYWDGDSYHYDDNWDEAVEPCSAPFDVSDAEGLKLEFDLCLDAESGYDYFYVEVSPDSGQSWYEVYKATGEFCWKHIEIPIMNASWMTEHFTFRFRFESDESGYQEGVFIDNVILEQIHTSYVEPQEILYEEFTPQERWTFDPAHLDNWMISNSNYAGGESPELEFSWYPSFVGDSYAELNPVDTTGYTTATLSFISYVNNFAGGYYLQVRVSPDGSTWNTVWNQYISSSGYYSPTINLDASDGIGSSTFYIRFYFSGDSFDINYWYIDNVNLSSGSDTLLFEDFSVQFPPDGWTRIKNTNEVNYYNCWWDYISYWYHSSPSSAGLWWGHAPQDEWLISPSLDFSQPYQYKLQFWTYNYGAYSGYWEGDYVKVSTDGGATWMTLDNLYQSAPPYPGGYMPAKLTYDLSMFAGNPDVRIAFHRWANQPGYPENLGIWFVDDVEVIAGGYTPGSEIKWVFNDDFEHGWKWCTPHAPKNLWHVQDASGEPQVPYGAGERPPYSEALNGSQFWACEKNHHGMWTYMNMMDDMLISPQFDMKQAYEAQLVFYAYGSVVPDNDSCFVSVRRIVDGTPQAWETPFRVDLMPGWNEYRLNLQPWVGPDSVIQFGFRFISDDNNEYTPGYIGWKVDDIKVDIKPDTAPPVTTCKISGNINGEWYTGPVAVELTATDDLSGVYQTWYRIDGGAWQLYTGRFQVTGDGSHTVEYYSIDQVGNVEDVGNCPEFKIDATPPTASIVTPQAGYIYIMGRQLFRNPLGGTIIIGKITFEATASDATSGVDYVHFEVDGMAYDDASSPYQVFWHNFNLLPHKYTLTVTPYDIAGNKGADQTVDFTHWL